MSLFSTNPVVLVDGGTTSRSFSSLGPIAGEKTRTGEWIEGSTSPASKESRLIVKQDASAASVRRRLISRRLMLPTSDGVTLKPVTINYSIAYDKEHDLSVIKSEGHVITLAAISKAEFFDNWTQGHT